MASEKTVEVPVKGMDCAECVAHVQHAIAQLPGVQSVEVFLSSEKAVLRLDPARVSLTDIRAAVAGAGYSVPEPAETASTETMSAGFNRSILSLFGVVFGAVLLIVIAGEGLGLFESITDIIPAPLGYVLVLIAGYPTFLNVVRAAMKRQVISHTLMSIGVIAALVVGQWVTAAIVVFFMRVGDYAERFTTERSRRALKNLTAMAPQTARVERNGQEQEVPLAEVQIGETVIVRPGEKIPVDGEVIAGQATINQAAITGESMPVEAGIGSKVFAATLAELGSLRIRTTHIGADTTFGRVIRLVEEAEAHRADVQRIADKFSAYFLPVVAFIALLTFLISRNPLSTAAVLVVACSCSLALATPIAMLASIGAAAKIGLLIKGGKYIEALARADVVLIDKTGTLTLGRPQLTDVITLNGIPENEILALAASAERYSEHPLAEAVRAEARRRNIALYEPQAFEAVPGSGVRAQINGSSISVGSRRLLTQPLAVSVDLEAQGKTALFVQQDGEVVGVMGASDTVRSEIPQAIAALRALGIQEISILTGDNERVASALAQKLGVNYRANLLPEEKIAIVKEYQAQGHIVVMVGDGVNDAPALAQANIGIAMGAAGTDVALEAAHIALMREDWTLVPEAIHIARRTMRVVKTNIAFTAIYNLLGLTLAAFGILPPILAAAAQSLPDLGILANSSRLLRLKRNDHLTR
ncbi:MAG: cadmium-translocating P-type ATPase [Chloroflexi bacterium]|nr:cadmium-translocating P-type ATPase [Chloroflexota bacterium]